MSPLPIVLAVTCAFALPSCVEAGCDPGCCTVPIAFEYSATVQDESTSARLQGIEVFCEAETSAIATTDDAGLVRFTVSTEQTISCGPARCHELRFVDPTNAHCPLVEQEFVSNTRTVALQAATGTNCP